MATLKWKLVGYDTFAGEHYPLGGEYDCQAAAVEAARACLAENERDQPTASSGGQDGIQDRVYIVSPDGKWYRFRGDSEVEAAAIFRLPPL